MAKIKPQKKLILLIRENKNGIVFITLYNSEKTLALEDFVCVKQIDINTALKTIDTKYECINKVIFNKI